MKLDAYIQPGQPTRVKVTLSARNLQALLSESARHEDGVGMIRKHEEDGSLLLVAVEPDEVHYREREAT